MERIGLRIVTGARRSVCALALIVAGAPVHAECLAFNREITRVLSNAAFEAKLAEHLNANLTRFGRIDWECLTHAYEVRGKTTKVEAFREPGGVVYRFTLDRSSNVLAQLSGDRVYSALVRVAPDGRVAVASE